MAVDELVSTSGVVIIVGMWRPESVMLLSLRKEEQCVVYIRICN